MGSRRTRARFIAAVLVVGALGVLCWIVVDQARAFSAYRRLHDLCVGGSASPESLRLAAEQSLEWRFGDPHLAFEVLLVHGNQSSIPLLRAALARKPVGESVACTWEHGEQALERLCEARGSQSGTE